MKASWKQICDSLRDDLNKLNRPKDKLNVNAFLRTQKEIEEQNEINEYQLDQLEVLKSFNLIRENQYFSAVEYFASCIVRLITNIECLAQYDFLTPDIEDEYLRVLNPKQLEILLLDGVITKEQVNKETTRRNEYLIKCVMRVGKSRGMKE